jgi:lipoprotein-anchoring transpeptidase ErfK/SrfK
MTNPDPTQIQLFLQQAYRGLRSGDRQQAMRWAGEAARLDPKLEEAWLLLAAAANNPQASIEFLKHALQINPGSPRARKGMQWAIQRLRASQTTAPKPTLQDTAPRKRLFPTPVAAAAVHPQAAPVDNAAPPATSVSQRTAPVRKPAKNLKKTAKATKGKSLGLRIGLISIFLISIAWLVWAGYPVILSALAGSPSSPRPDTVLVKPTLTYTSTATSTPTSTPTPTPTATFTPTETPTNTPTETPLPEPTNTPLPGNPENVVIPAEVGEDTKWVDIDLSEQMLYVYQGRRLLQAYLISSGTSAHPTVTGQFHIYVKYRYADMSGPGYYLPDVPYVMYFYDGYGLHGTYWHHNFGTPMSHGCVNMLTEEAGWLFDFAPVGTLVNIHY